MEDIGSETTGTDRDGLVLIFTDLTRQLKQLHSLLECDGLHALLFGKLGEHGLVFVLGSTHLYDRTETTDLYKDRTTSLRIKTKLTLTSLMCISAVHGVFYLRDEVIIEMMHHVCPFLLTFGNLIEVKFHLGGEIVVHDVVEVLYQEVIDHDADIRRNQFAFLRAYILLAGLLGYLLTF